MPVNFRRSTDFSASRIEGIDTVGCPGAERANSSCCVLRGPTEATWAAEVGPSGEEVLPPPYVHLFGFAKTSPRQIHL